MQEVVICYDGVLWYFAQTGQVHRYIGGGGGGGEVVVLGGVLGGPVGVLVFFLEPERERVNRGGGGGGVIIGRLVGSVWAASGVLASHLMCLTLRAVFVKHCSWAEQRKELFCCRGQLKCSGTRVETTFRLSAKRTRPFKSAGGVISVDCWQPRCALQQ